MKRSFSPSDKSRKKPKLAIDNVSGDVATESECESTSTGASLADSEIQILEEICADEIVRPDEKKVSFPEVVFCEGQQPKLRMRPTVPARKLNLRCQSIKFKRCDIQLAKVPLKLKNIGAVIPCQTDYEVVPLMDAAVHQEGYYMPYYTGKIEDGVQLGLSGKVNGTTFFYCGVIYSYEKVYRDKMLASVIFHTDLGIFDVVFSASYKSFLRSKPSDSYLEEIRERKIQVNGKLTKSSQFTDQENGVSSSTSSINMDSVLSSLNISEDASQRLEKIDGLLDLSDSVRSMIAAFFSFVVERQNIWLRRRRKEPVLTENIIFKKKKFTNIFREIDRGTQYFRAAVLLTLVENCSSRIKPGVELISRILIASTLYRIINKLETFESFGAIPTYFTITEFLCFLDIHKAKKKIIFTDAHQNMGLERAKSTIMYVKKNIHTISSLLEAAESDSEALSIIQRIANIGDFLSWQIFCDLKECRVLPKLDKNDSYVVLGPGAKLGIKFIFGQCNFNQACKFLLNISQKVFDELGLNLQCPPRIRFNLKAVEHALCEFSKYCRYATKGVSEKDCFFKKSRQNLDHIWQCMVCLETSSSQEKSSCPLCNRNAHIGCLESPPEEDWICGDCELIQDAEF